MTDEELNDLSRKHRIRGSILRAACGLVKTSDDLPASLASFHRIVGTDVAREAEIRQQADYLVAAGYLEAVMGKRAARDEARLVGYRPTVKGVQLHEGDIDDPAVEFKTL